MKPKKLTNFNLLDSHVFEVVISQPEDATLKITKGKLIRLAEFQIQPESQQHLVALEKEYIGT